MRDQRCAFCGQKAHFRCRATDELLCLDHAAIEVIAAAPAEPGAVAVASAVKEDSAGIVALAHHFWDEVEVYCFDRIYDLSELPAFVVSIESVLVGALSYSIEPRQLVIVLLAVLPGFQGRGIATNLIDAATGEAVARGLPRVAVATSNDDLPALYLYQRNGFTISEVRPGEILQHHAGELSGFAGIPIRDEIRLVRTV